MILKIFDKMSFVQYVMMDTLSKLMINADKLYLTLPCQLFVPLLITLLKYHFPLKTNLITLLRLTTIMLINHATYLT